MRTRKLDKKSKIEKSQIYKNVGKRLYPKFEV